MSRLDSNSPQPSPALSRRAVLPGIVAVSTALAGATGQAFSRSNVGDDFSRAHLAESIAADERFAEFDRLAAEIIDLELRQDEALQEYDEETIADVLAEHEEDPDGPEPWVILWQRLVNDEMTSFAAEHRRPPQSFLDVVLQAKIADYYFAYGDADFNEVNEICPLACRHALETWGLRPLTPITELRALKPSSPAEIREERPTPPWGGVNAGNLIARLRTLGQAVEAAIRFEAALDDGTPRSDRAIAVTDRRMAEIETFRDEFLSARSRPSIDIVPEDPYRLNDIEHFTVLCELITAIFPSFWTEAHHDGLRPVIAELRKAGTVWSHYYLEQAQRWNASQGGANV